MALDEVYSLTTKEGHEYKIGFSAFDIFKLPENVNKDVVDVTIAIEDNKGINNASSLFQISAIIKDYLSKNDVILYCYCDTRYIERSILHQEISSQEYRSLLFQRMFNRASNNGFINKPIILTDLNDMNHCIHLISSIDNLEDIEALSNEILKMQK